MMKKPPLSYLQVVCAIIQFRGRVLAVKRAAKGHPATASRWEFPGGKIEPNEEKAAAIVREITEELALPISVDAQLCTHTHHYPAQDGVAGFFLTITALLCTAQTDQLTLHEHTDARWLLPEQLPPLDWAAADIPILHDYLAQNQNISQ